MSVAELRATEGKWRRGDAVRAGKSIKEIVAFGVLKRARGF
jgi:hypothetical protein